MFNFLTFFKLAFKDLLKIETLKYFRFKLYLKELFTEELKFKITIYRVGA